MALKAGRRWGGGEGEARGREGNQIVWHLGSLIFNAH